MKNKIKNFISNHRMLFNSFISFLVSLVLMVGLFFWHSNNTLVGWINITFSSSIILIAFSLLIYISQEGTFNYLVFSLKSFGRLFIKRKRHETYIEYIERKSKREKVAHMSLFFGSLPLLFVSIILMLIYY